MTWNHVVVVKIVIYRLTTIPSYEATHQGDSQTESKEIIAIIAILLVIIIIPVIIIIIMIIIVIMMTLIILVMITEITRTVTIITIIMQAMILTIFNLEEAEKNLTDVIMWWEASLHPLAIDRNRTLTKEAGVKRSSKSVVFLFLTPR